MLRRRVVLLGIDLLLCAHSGSAGVSPACAISAHFISERFKTASQGTEAKNRT